MSERDSEEKYDHTEKFGYPEEWGQVEFRDKDGNPLTTEEWMIAMGMEVPDELGSGPPDASERSAEATDGGERYDPARKFGHPEDQDQYQTYFDEEGNELTHDEFVARVSEDAAKMRARGESTKSEYRTLPPLP